MSEGLPTVYAELSRFLTDDFQAADPPFSADLLNPEGWFVVNQYGEKRGIELPAIYDDGTIMFRYR